MLCSRSTKNCASGATSSRHDETHQARVGRSACVPQPKQRTTAHDKHDRSARTKARRARRRSRTTRRASKRRASRASRPSRSRKRAACASCTSARNGCKARCVCSKPDHIELEYAQQMMAWLLFIETPKRIVQLGLGAAALTKFAHRVPEAREGRGGRTESGGRDRRAHDVRAAARRRASHRARDGRVGLRQRPREPRHDRRVADRSSTMRPRAARCSTASAFYRACRACLTRRGRRDDQPVRRSSELRAQHEASERSVRRSRDRAAGSARRQPHRDRVLGSGARRAVRRARKRARS